MKYELISTKPMLNKITYELTVTVIPEGIRDLFNSPGKRTYHGKDQEWYRVPGYERCIDDTLCSKLSHFYNQAKSTAESTPNPNQNTI